MEKLTYDEIDVKQTSVGYKNGYFLLAKHIKKELASVFSQKYGIDGRDIDEDTTITIQLPRILWVVQGDLKDKTVLDLGCGSKYSDDNHTFFGPKNRFYEPWLARALTEIGVRVIGIDIADNSSEEFEYHRVNLFEEGALDFIPDYSIDVANANFLFNSPTFYRSNARRIDIQKVLLPQLERIVKPEGFFISSH